MDGDPVIEIFSGTLWEAEFIRTLLLDNEIDAFVKNSVLSTYVYEPLFSSGVKVMIKSSDYEEAIKIVNDFMKAKKSDSQKE